MTLQEQIAMHRDPKVIPFPKNDRWLICPCNKCKARREELPRVG